MTQGLSMDISMIYIALSGLLMVGLAVDVVRGRLKYQVGLGDGGHEALGRRIRVHGNAVEYLPIGLLLLLAVENSVSSGLLVHLLGGLLVFCRLLHGFGLRKSAGTSLPRFIGTAGTWSMMLVSVGLILANSF
tara:strand:- start:17 stop:415 length:399 start_codon:yes stop_codon:yes gene_type:complete